MNILVSRTGTDKDEDVNLFSRRIGRAINEELVQVRNFIPLEALDDVFFISFCRKCYCRLIISKEDELKFRKFEGRTHEGFEKLIYCDACAKEYHDQLKLTFLSKQKELKSVILLSSNSSDEKTSGKKNDNEMMHKSEKNDEKENNNYNNIEDLENELKKLLKEEDDLILKKSKFFSVHLNSFLVCLEKYYNLKNRMINPSAEREGWSKKGKRRRRRRKKNHFFVFDDFSRLLRNEMEEKFLKLCKDFERLIGFNCLNNVFFVWFKSQFVMINDLIINSFSSSRDSSINFQEDFSNLYSGEIVESLDFEEYLLNTNSKSVLHMIVNDEKNSNDNEEENLKEGDVVVSDDSLEDFYLQNAAFGNLFLCVYCVLRNYLGVMKNDCIKLEENEVIFLKKEEKKKKDVMEIDISWDKNEENNNLEFFLNGSQSYFVLDKKRINFWVKKNIAVFNKPYILFVKLLAGIRNRMISENKELGDWPYEVIIKKTCCYCKCPKTEKLFEVKYFDRKGNKSYQKSLKMILTNLKWILLNVRQNSNQKTI